ncbi:Kelch repeat-containing protein 3 [Elasticomyces elasticus]|nr:Kelch repeat-containing protein 3 [Elasticomyces elasticus]KAK4969332.1 Kelch repeat-containing protein 3 [Elasticomyces elasticus]
MPKAKGKDAAKQAEKKARKAGKQEKKSSQKEKKISKKTKDDDSDAEDADLDSILAAYQKEQEQHLAIIEVTANPPSPRSSATLVASPSNNSELFLFGGEYYNGALASFYSDLYVYKINQDVWRKATSPNSPLPRSGHAMCQGGNAGGIYMFGGEFSSPKQGTFYHYNDFWRLEPSTREWTKLEGKGGPPARSGHRMTYFKNYIVLFGGFQDTSQQTRYLQDIWLYDTQRFSWHEPKLPPASMKPDARSSFSLLPHESGAVLYGGYSRVKVSTTAGKATKGGKAGSKVTMKPLVHQDTWYLRITPPAADAPVGALPTVRWERRKRPVNSPNPARAGATMAHHKGRGISFGGVHDVEESEEGIDSEFFNQLFAYNIDRNRFFTLSLRRPRTSAKKAGGGNAERGKRGRGRADEEELLRNLALIEGKGVADVELPDADEATHTGDGEEAGEKIEKPVSWEMPHPRFNGQLAVQEDTLYIFGGILEKGDVEYTFDEMWAIDLGKLDGCKEIFRREIEDWQGSEDEESDDEDDEGSEESDDEDGGVDIAAGSSVASADEPSTPASSVAPFEAPIEEDDVPAVADKLPHPRPFESLREFFARTSNDWQEAVLDWLRYQHDIEHSSIKDLRKKAFDRAEQKWWDCREEIQTLEDEQEAAGISEVVALDQRGGGGEGGASKRR